MSRLRRFIADEPVICGAVFTLLTVLATRFIGAGEITEAILGVIAAALGVGIPAVIVRSKVTPEPHKRAELADARREGRIEGAMTPRDYRPPPVD